MAWRVRLEKRAKKDLKSLGSADQERVARFIRDRLVPIENPRDIGGALVGQLSGYWKYRVGDFRLVSQINDHEITIMIIRIGNRREIYR